MTHLNIQSREQANTPDGQVVQLPPNVALQRSGPCLQVSITVAEIVAEQLLQQGKELPQPISGIALIDTGASNTCIDDKVAQQLRLPVVDIIQIASASHSANLVKVYPAQIEIVGSSITLNASRAAGVTLDTQGYIALIGRDVLQNFTLFYNGPTGQITLSI